MSQIYGRIGALQVSTHAGPSYIERQSGKPLPGHDTEDRRRVQLTVLSGAGEIVLTAHEAYILSMVLQQINLGITAQGVNRTMKDDYPEWIPEGQ